MTAVRPEGPLVTTPGMSERFATFMLLFACVMWGMSFTWAKGAGEAINAVAGRGDGSAFGPVWLLAVRFGVAAAAWMAVSRRAWRGWTRRGLARGAGLGGLLSAGLVLQHLALDRSSEATTAFLTSLVVVSVPVTSWAFQGRRPTAVVWAGVGVATLGVWLMTGAGGGGFGAGEALGLACAGVWGLYIVAVNVVGPREDPARLTAAQFVVTAAVTGAWSLGMAWGDPGVLATTALDPRVWPNAALLAVFATVVAYGILTFYQPAVDATRASLLYLAEPIFAAAFAWWWVSRPMTVAAIAGAALILTANVLVEVLASRARVVVPD